MDALITINEQQNLSPTRISDSEGRLPNAATVAEFPDFYFDATGDGFIVPLDTLRIINHLNANGSTAVPEGEEARGGEEELGRGGYEEELYFASVVVNQPSSLREETKTDARRQLLTTAQASQPDWVKNQTTERATPPPRRAPAAAILDPKELTRIVDELFAGDEFWQP